MGVKTVRHQAALKAWDKRGRKRADLHQARVMAGVQARKLPDSRFARAPVQQPAPPDSPGADVIAARLRFARAPVQQPAPAPAPGTRAPEPAAPKSATGDWTTAKGPEIEQRNIARVRQENQSFEKTHQLGEGQHVNEVWKVKFADGSPGVMKPQYGLDKRDLRGPHIKPGDDIQREVGASELARDVGMEDMVGACVDRVDAKEGRVLLQEWGEGDPARELTDRERWGKSPEDVVRSGVYDVMIGNMDRHSGNWVVSPSGKIRLIDHGLALPTDPFYWAGNGNESFIRRCAAEPELRNMNARPHIEKYVGALKKSADRLTKAGVPPKAVAAYRARVQMIGLALQDKKGDFTFGDLSQVVGAAVSRTGPFKHLRDKYDAIWDAELKSMGAKKVKGPKSLSSPIKIAARPARPPTIPGGLGRPRIVKAESRVMKLRSVKGEMKPPRNSGSLLSREARWKRHPKFTSWLASVQRAKKMRGQKTVAPVLKKT